MSVTTMMESHPSLSASQNHHPTDVGRQRLLRMPPVDPGQQITELRRRDRHHTVGRARPQETAALQPLREQAGALAVMPDHLQQIAAPAAEAEQMAAQRIALQHLLHLQAPATESPSSCRCGRSQATPARRSATGSSGRPPDSAATAAVNVAGSTAPVIRSRTPLQTRSRSSRQFLHEPSMPAAPAQPRPPQIAPRSPAAAAQAHDDARSRLRRQTVRRLGCTSCRRATSTTLAEGAWLSSTIRSFSTVVHRRRRSGPDRTETLLTFAHLLANQSANYRRPRLSRKAALTGGLTHNRKRADLESGCRRPPRWSLGWMPCKDGGRLIELG